MSGHTKGPWKACGTIYEYMNCEIRSGAKGEGQGIAQVWDGPNAFRDGLLMAAAPDMYDALMKIAADGGPYRSGYCQTDISVDPALTAEEAQTLARAAIARADGGGASAAEGAG